MNETQRDAALRLADALDRSVLAVCGDAAEQSHSADTIVETFNRISDGITHHAEFSNAPVVMCSKQHYDALAAEPSPDPVAWIYGDEYGDACHWVGGRMPTAGTKLYAAPQPPQREPLTDEEIRALWTFPRDLDWMSSVIQLARAVERAHGIGGSDAD